MFAPKFSSDLEIRSRKGDVEQFSLKRPPARRLSARQFVRTAVEDLMPRLFLMRHAKSAWDDHGLPDHERPLNARGRLAATLMGEWLAEQLSASNAHASLSVAVSTSRRTRETWARVARQLDPAPTPSFEADLYHADPEVLLERVAATEDTRPSLLLIGHNPGLEALSAALCAQDGARTGRYPTAAIGVFDLDRPWAQAAFGCGRLIEFEQPKTLV